MDDGRRFGAVTRSPLKQGRVTTVSDKVGRRPTHPSGMRGTEIVCGLEKLVRGTRGVT
jgi:hypothetical protein